MLSSKVIASFFLLCSLVLHAETVVIGHANVPKLDVDTVQKMFTGRVVVVQGVAVIPVHAPRGSRTRSDFLDKYLQQNEEKYQAYWTVRQFVGKGRQPRTLNSVAAVIDFVRNTKGAVGYVDANDLPPDINVLARR